MVLVECHMQVWKKGAVSLKINKINIDTDAGSFAAVKDFLRKSRQYRSKKILGPARIL